MILPSHCSVVATATLVCMFQVSSFSTIPSSTRSRDPRLAQNKPPRRVDGSSRNSNEEATQGQGGLDDDDFSFLKQWPMMPTTESATTTVSSESSANPTVSQQWSAPPSGNDPKIISSRYRGTNPLVNFVQLVEMVAPLQQQDPTKNSSSNIFKLADTLFRNVMDNTGGLFPSPNETTTVQDFMQQRQWFDSLQLTLLDSRNTTTGQSSPESSPLSSPTTLASSRLSVTQASVLATASNPNASGTAFDAIFQEATSRVEYLVQEAASLNYPSVIPELMEQTRQLFAFLKKTETEGTTVTEKNQLLNVAEPEQLRETTTYAANFMAVANAIFTSGYVTDKGNDVTSNLALVDIEAPKPLLVDFPSAERILPKDYQEVVNRGAEMGTLAGAIYEDTVRRSLQLGHSLVARGVTTNVAWMVTDSLMEGKMVRTLTIRGFDASDETVNREALLNVICSPEPVRLVDDKDVLFHKGLLTTAQAIYADVGKYFDWTTADQKIVLNGHSIGGSLSILVLLLMTVDRGVDYVKQKVARVFAHGNPPIAYVLKRPRGMREFLDCPVLKTFNLPSDIIYCYIQPYVSNDDMMGEFGLHKRFAHLIHFAYTRTGPNRPFYDAV